MLKAYHVKDMEGEYQEIVFAETNGKAKMKSEARGWVDYTDIRAKRAPAFDKYADLGKVPTQDMLENGWRFECYKCYKYVDVDDAKVSEKDNVFCEECFKSL